MGVEIQQVERVDVGKIVQPVASLQTVTDGSGDVGYYTVGEVVLLAPLHLDDEAVAFIVGAIDVIHKMFFRRHAAEKFRIEVADGLDVSHLVGEDTVEETDEHVLVLFRAEDALEPEVAQRVNVDDFIFHSQYILLPQKYIFILY